MRVVALYDIHGNLPALESVLEELQGVTIDQIVVRGDVLSGPMQVHRAAVIVIRTTALPHGE